MAAISTPLIVLLGLAGIALGALGAYLLARLEVSRAAAATPFVSLLVTLRPLLLPLLAAVLVGLFQVAAVALLLGAALLTFAAGWMLVVPEASRLRTAGAWDLRVLRRHGLWLGAAIAVLTVGGKLLASGRSLELIGGFASFLLILALALWLLALVLRLVSHCSSWLRSGVAFFVACTIYRLTAAIGLVPGGDFISDHLSFLDCLLPIAAAVFILIEAGLDSFAAKRGEDPHGQKQTERLPGFVRRIRGGGLKPGCVQLFQGFGLGVALLAALVLLLAAWVGLAQTDQPGKRLSTDTATEAAEAATPPPPSGYSSDQALAVAYSPVLALTRAERWSPIPYGGYVDGAVLSGPLTTPLGRAPSVAEKLGVSCPHLSSAPCFRLSIRCPTGNDACSGAEPHPTRSDEGLYREGAAYVRVVRRGAEEALEERRNTEHVRKSDRWPPQVFREEGPYATGPDAKRLSILLQYWYFYRYDEWETHVFAGKLVQRHEGDWEAVTVGLSDTEPLFVAYSAHCAGTWVPWEEAEISDRLGGRTHPVVAVAEGSHANYPRADQKRSPDWAGCQGAPRGTTTLLSYASNIRDKTEYGWEWYPEEGDLHLVSENEPPMSFPGYWGASEDTTLYGFFRTTRLGEGHGPETPSEQPLWRTPVTKIFCGNYSQPDLPPSLPHRYCPKSTSKE